MAGNARARARQDAAKKTPAAPAAKKTVGVPTVDPDVFKGLTITAETEPLPKATRDTGPNQFMDSVRDSYGPDAPAFGIVVPANAVKRAVYLIRKAAREQDKGIRIIEDKQADGTVKIRFKAKDKKKSTKKDTANA